MCFASEHRELAHWRKYSSAALWSASACATNQPYRISNSERGVCCSYVFTCLHVSKGTFFNKEHHGDTTAR
eukprot:5622018-Pyramimonas_sp.AAC.1